MNAIDPEEMAGDYIDYLAKQDIERHADAADHAGEMHAALGQKHADLVTAFEALAAEFDRDGSHYHRDRVLAVLKEN